MSKSALTFLGLLQLVICLSLGYLFVLVTEKDATEIIVFSLVSFFIYFSSSWISFFGIPKDKSFVVRLMILLTLQILFFLSVAIALIYTGDDRLLVLYFLGLFLLLMIIQSIALVKFRQ
jgi:hypothetical protein